MKKLFKEQANNCWHGLKYRVNMDKKGPPTVAGVLDFSVKQMVLSCETLKTSLSQMAGSRVSIIANGVSP